MEYPPKINRKIIEYLDAYCEQKYEYGAPGVNAVTREIDEFLHKMLEKVRGLAGDKERSAQNPDDLEEILRQRPQGPRKLWQSLDPGLYLDKLEGALLARLAGCTLGAPVEFWSIQKMQDLARETGFSFPPRDYWPYVHEPYRLRYSKSMVMAYTRDKMDGVPVDDDIVYTLLGLLIVEEQGLDFSVADAALTWLKYLPYACTAEEVVLANLKKGIAPLEAAQVDNPYTEWIGASIRADPWGYLAPGQPELAARMAYKDAYLTHRRQGIYGEMFFAAAIAAAFTTDNPLDALKIGLTEIPGECQFARDIRWALETAREIRSYQDARLAIEERFDTMSHAHTNNNACLTVFGLAIGGTDMSRVISETVAMGYDNDCTAATAGSIVGAIVGKKGIEAHWYQNFNNKIYTYLNNLELMYIDDVIKRFYTQAQKLFV